jgi:hypothetical protein
VAAWGFEMKKQIGLLIAAVLVSLPASARGGHGGSSHSSSSSHSVSGHTTKNGTYVKPHRQTNPNGTQKDNYSTKGNVNPHTGKKGTKNATH